MKLNSDCFGSFVTKCILLFKPLTHSRSAKEIIEFSEMYGYNSYYTNTILFLLQHIVYFIQLQSVAFSFSPKLLIAQYLSSGHSLLQMFLQWKNWFSYYFVCCRQILSSCRISYSHWLLIVLRFAVENNILITRRSVIVQQTNLWRIKYFQCLTLSRSISKILTIKFNGHNVLSNGTKCFK